MCDACILGVNRVVKSLLDDYGSFFGLMSSQSEEDYDDDEAGDEHWLYDFLKALAEGKEPTVKLLRRLVTDSAVFISAMESVRLTDTQAEQVIQEMNKWN